MAVYIAKRVYEMFTDRDTPFIIAIENVFTETSAPVKNLEGVIKDSLRKQLNIVFNDTVEVYIIDTNEKTKRIGPTRLIAFRDGTWTDGTIEEATRFLFCSVSQIALDIIVYRDRPLHRISENES